MYSILNAMFLVATRLENRKYDNELRREERNRRMLKELPCRARESVSDSDCNSL